MPTEGRAEDVSLVTADCTISGDGGMLVLQAAEPDKFPVPPGESNQQCDDPALRDRWRGYAYRGRPRLASWDATECEFCHTVRRDAEASCQKRCKRRGAIDNGG